jgi:dihydrofolate reductase
MSKVFAQASVSLDGYIAGPGESGFEHLFAWCTAGEVETPSADPERLTYRTNAATAEYLHELIDGMGAAIVGRRLFDVTNGWNGSHPLGKPIFVVTHEAPEGWADAETPFTFVTDGIETAIEKAKAAARGKDVGVGPGSTVGQALRAGLIDEIRVDLVPLILGGGVRMFDGLADGPRTFGTPQVIEGIGVTHLIYRLS